MNEISTRENVLPEQQGKGLFAWFRKFFPMNIRGQAVLLLVPTIIIVSLVYTLESISTERRILKDEIIKKGEAVAAIAARNAELPVLSENLNQLQYSARTLMEIKDVVFVTFFNKRRTLLLNEGIVHPTEPLPSKPPDEAIFFTDHSNFLEFTAPVFTVRGKEELLFFSEKDVPAPTKEHIGWVRVGLSKEIMSKSERMIIIRGALLAILFTLAGVVLLYFFVSLATKPLSILIKAVKEVRKGGYAEVTVTSSKSEIGKLCAEFNRMSRAIKEREEAVLASERRIKDLFERVEHAIFRLDRTGAIIETNKKFDVYCGGAKNFASLFKGNPGVRDLKKTASGALRSVEETIIGSDGNELVVSMSLYPDFDGDNTLLGFDGYFIDITDKKKLEDRLSQAQKMESVGLLAGGVAHDFNNLLTPILGYAELLLTMQPPDDTRTNPPLSQIKKAAERARDLTRQLLAFSRKQLLELKTANLGYIIRMFESMLRRTILENIAIEVKIAPDLNMVLADTGQIEQVLLNLAINAQDAMPNGGTLTIEAQNIDLDESYTARHPEIAPGKYVMLSVSDTGTGMDDATRSHIFEPFFTTKELGRGTGLGLSTVYGIVKQHGGSISVYSEPGQGSVFKVFLPQVVDQQATAVQQQLPEAVAHGIEIILVVEDNEMVRGLARDILTSLGYQVLVAEDPNQCIELVKTLHGPLHLLLTDVVMPTMNGVDLYNNLHLLRPDMKVLFMSGYASHMIGQHGVLDEGMHFIQKPFSLHALSQKIRQVLDA